MKLFKYRVVSKMNIEYVSKESFEPAFVGSQAQITQSLLPLVHNILIYIFVNARNIVNYNLCEFAFICVICVLLAFDTSNLSFVHKKLFCCFHHKNIRFWRGLHIIADIISGVWRLIVSHILPCNTQAINRVVH